MTIELRPGMKVHIRWQHVRKPRWFVALSKKTGQPLLDENECAIVRKDFKPGGITRCIVEIVVDEQTVTLKAQSKCSIYDNYSKAKGRKESLKNLFEADEEYFDKSLRAEVWKKLGVIPAEG